MRSFFLVALSTMLLLGHCGAAQADTLVYDSFNDSAGAPNFIEIGKYSPPSIIDIQGKQIFAPTNSGLLSEVTIRRIYHMDVAPDFGPLQIELREVVGGASLAVVDVDRLDVPDFTSTPSLDAIITVDFSSFNIVLQAGVQYEIVLRLATPQTSTPNSFGYWNDYIDIQPGTVAGERSLDGGVTWGPFPSTMELRVSVDRPTPPTVVAYDSFDLSPLFGNFRNIGDSNGTTDLQEKQYFTPSESGLASIITLGRIQRGADDGPLQVELRVADTGPTLGTVDIEYLDVPATPSTLSVDFGPTGAAIVAGTQYELIARMKNSPSGPRSAGYLWQAAIDATDAVESESFSPDGGATWLEQPSNFFEIQVNVAVAPSGNGVDPRLKLWESRGPNIAYDVDVSAPDAVNPITQGVTEDFIASVEYGFGAFYAPSSTNVNPFPLFVLDPSTGALLDTITMTFPPGGTLITSVEFVGATLYGGFTTGGSGSPNPSSLVTIDTTTGVVSLIGPMGIDDPTGGLAYRAGTMYTVNSGAGGAATLYTVNLTTGVATPVAPVLDAGTGAPVSLTGLEFGADGVLYGLGRGIDDDVLFSIDPSNGFAFRIGVMPSIVGGTTKSTALTSVPIDPELVLLKSSGATELYDLDVDVPDVSGPLPVATGNGSIASLDYGLGAFYLPSARTTNPTPLYVVEPGTGAILNTLTMSFPAGGTGITSVEFIGSTLYGGFATLGDNSAPSSLVTIDTTTGAVSLVGAMGFNNPNGGLAFDGATMYTISAGGAGSTLYTVNLSTGVATAVGAVLDDAGAPVGLTGLEFGNDGLLYALGNYTGDGNNLYVIDPSTGAATRLGQMPSLPARGVALTSTPTDCGFFNPSFEAGSFFGWNAQDLTDPFSPLSVSPGGDNAAGWPWNSAPTEGLHTAFHGFDGNGATSGFPILLSQDVTVTERALRFDWRAAWSITVGTPTGNRTLDVVIRPAGGGAELLRVNILTALAGTDVPDSGQSTSEVNLSSFLGQTVRVEFEWNVPEDFTGPAQFQFDNVCFVALDCPADLTGDGNVDGADLAALLSQWGTPGSADLTGDGNVDGADLAALLAAWGACP